MAAFGKLMLPVRIEADNINVVPHILNYRSSAVS